MFSLCKNVQIVHEHHQHYVQVENKKRTVDHRYQALPQRTREGNILRSAPHRECKTERGQEVIQMCTKSNASHRKWSRGIDVTCRNTMKQRSNLQINISSTQFPKKLMPEYQIRHQSQILHNNKLSPSNITLRVNSSLKEPKAPNVPIKYYQSTYHNQAGQFGQISTQQIYHPVQPYGRFTHKAQSSNTNGYQTPNYQQKMGTPTRNSSAWPSQDSLNLKKRIIFNSSNFNIKINEVEREQIGKIHRIPAISKMLDDAISIVSRQSQSIHEQFNIQESIMISRTVDMFQLLDKELNFNLFTMSLAREKNSGKVITLKVYEKEKDCLRELELLDQLEQDQEYGSLILKKYQVLIQGGLFKKIILLQSPYDDTFRAYLEKRCQSTKKDCVSFTNTFLVNVKGIVNKLQNRGIVLLEALKLSDFVLEDGMLKLHSLSKFGRYSPHLANSSHSLYEWIPLEISQIYKP